MRIKFEHLKSHLDKQKLLPIYLISSDEPCLILDAENLIKDKAKAEYFIEKEVFDVDTKFNWLHFMGAIQSRSLFSKLKLIELRFSVKPDVSAQKNLIEYFGNINTDLIILIRVQKLDTVALRAKWISALDPIGGILVLYAPDRNALPRWIEIRAAQEGIKLSSEAVRFLSEHDEGNLLAIVQEISRLKVLYGNQSIDLNTLKSIMTDSARFSIFDLPDAVLIGDLARILRMITQLKQEGEAPILINWALQKEIRLLTKMVMQMAAGKSLESVLSDVWEKRRPLYQNALRRFNLKHVKILSKMSIEIDRSIKGDLKENPWDAILRVCFALAGRSFLPLSCDPR